MSLRNSLLALLASGPLTGYDASKHFSDSVVNVWHASDSQIYPELRRMEAEGLVEAQEVPWGPNGATKNEYNLTHSGFAELENWQSEPTEYPTTRDPMRLKAAYFEWGDAIANIARLREHIDHHQKIINSATLMIEKISKDLHPTLVRRVKGLQDPRMVEHVVWTKIYAYEGIISSSEAEISWAQRGIRHLERYRHVEQKFRNPPINETNRF
ncbi:PadR family transcriptional regulator [Corynebacterium poyangense]|uniref:PadR family transcriptional regulator n=2 Tax=Corynebacterium poyangense TaxID=2684405 RepID=A0A7H0SSG4_9CORY|nr:PadR family transcriptional regulator [Corynebacterium poyangense]QNQ91489.1 PadR family transcriptional regulator [Corynebacterium poyangense]